MANPFAKKINSQSIAYGASANSSLQFSIQNRQDPTEYAEEMIKRSGGDARAAFFLACKEKGIDPNSIIQQVQAIKNPQAAIQGALMNGLGIQRLMSLVSNTK